VGFQGVPTARRALRIDRSTPMSELVSQFGRRGCPSQKFGPVLNMRCANYQSIHECFGKLSFVSGPFYREESNREGASIQIIPKSSYQDVAQRIFNMSPVSQS